MDLDNQTRDLRLIKYGDINAFERLYRQYWEKVLNFARIFIQEQEKQEEIVQQVFIKLWEKRNKIDENNKIDGFLFIITRNIIFNDLHKTEIENKIKDELKNIVDPTYDQGIDSMEIRDILMDLITKLPPKQHETLILRKYYGMSYKEIAKKMSISVKGVERNLSLAIKFLRKGLSSYKI